MAITVAEFLRRPYALRFVPVLRKFYVRNTSRPMLGHNSYASVELNEMRASSERILP